MQISHDTAWDDFLEEFTSIFSVYDLNKHKIFICGSYSEDTFITLQEVQKIVNSIENNLGFFEKDFRRTHLENLILKFDLIAKFSNEIIMIIEHDKGGHMIEMGIILSFREFYEKTKIFVLKDAEITEVLKRGGLLTPFFREEHSLFYFEDLERLRVYLKQLYT
ncbi:MAG: hypothetical protein JSV62_08645 [Promethearchaeota archaeon]|nr:MAG: hypothetical protein JSV62_08645 [Candidatus Lokiarchaeota archaeon]